MAGVCGTSTASCVVNSCSYSVNTLTCNGAGSCTQTYSTDYFYAPAQQVYTSTGCATGSGYCDSTWRCSTGNGNGAYNKGSAGFYTAQGTCDGSGGCDYAINAVCDNTCANAYCIARGYASGTCSGGVASCSPPPPSGLAATARPDKPLNKEQGNITLTWTDGSTTEQGFRIERGPNRTSFSEIATVSANVVYYKDDNRDDNTYCYRVRSYNGTVNSTYSNTACVATLDRTLPEATTLNVTPNNPSNKIDLSFLINNSVVIWPLDDSPSGSIETNMPDDISGNNRHATTYSGGPPPAWSNSIYATGNMSVQFGISGASSFGTTYSASLSAFTIAAWIYPTTLTNYRAIVNTSNTAGFLTKGTALVFYYNGDNALTATGLIPTSSWTHVAVTYDGSKITTYVNGVPEATTSTTGAKSFTRLNVGAGGSGDPNYFQGYIDDVRVFNASLSQSKITNIMGDRKVTVGFSRSTANNATAIYTPVNGTVQNFTAANGDITTLSGWTKNIPAGNTSTYTIENNRFKLFLAGADSSESNSYAQYTIPIAINGIVKVEFDITWNSTSSWGFSYRTLDSSARLVGWQASYGSGYTWNIYDGTAWLYGNVTAPALTPGNTYHVSQLFDFTAKTMKWYFNEIFWKETKMRDTASVDLKYIRFANYGYGTANAIYYIDNLKVTPLFNSSSISDTNAKDLNKPSTLGTPTVTALAPSGGSGRLNVSWVAGADIGTTYYFYSEAHDITGNSENLLLNRGFERNASMWSVNTSYANISITPYAGYYSLFVGYNGGNWAGSSQCKYRGNYTLDKYYYAEAMYKCTSGSGNAKMFFGDSVNYGIYATSATAACTGNWEPIRASLFMPSSQPANGTFCIYVYGNYATSGVYYDNIVWEKMGYATVTTGIKDYYVDQVAGTPLGTGADTYYNSPATNATVTGLNCFTSYNFTIAGRDNQNNQGTASPASSGKYPIDGVSGCSGKGTQGWCNNTATNCYYTGSGCLTCTSSCTNGFGTSCCPTSTTYIPSTTCGSGGCTQPSYERDTGSSYCRAGQSGIYNTSCTANSWFVNTPNGGSGGPCCGDDGGGVDVFYYNSSNPSTATSLTCERCNNGGYSAPTTLYGNGATVGSTCFYTDITCSVASGANGTSCSLTTGGTCVDAYGCLNTPTGLTATAEQDFPLNSDLANITLTWTDNSGTVETGFNIERSTNNGTYTKITTTAADATTYTDSSLTDNTYYCYRVNASRGSSYSAYSGIACAFTPDRTAPSSPNFAPGKRSLIAYWKFDEGSGVLALDSASNNTGNLTSSPTWVSSGRVGNALSFDGSVKYVAVPPFSLTDSDFTVLVWFKRNGPSGGSSNQYHEIIGGLNGQTGYNNRLLADSAGSFVFAQLSNGSAVSSPTMSVSSDGQWAQVGMILSGTNFYTVANGAISSATTFTGSLSSDTNNLTIGIGKSGATTFYQTNGTIDEVKIFNRALTATEIAEEYANSEAYLSWTETDNGLVAYLPFEEGAGSTTTDWSSNLNDGTITGATWTNPAKYGAALAFDGSGDYVKVPRTTSLEPSSMTLEAWIYPENVTANQRIFSKLETGGGYRLTLTSAAKIQALVSNASYSNFTTTSVSTISTDTWYHVAVTINSTAINIYLNGILDTTGSFNGNIFHYSSPLCIGRESTATSCGSTTDFNGTIDEVRIYNRALTQGEIISDMQSGLIGKAIYTSPTLSGSYRLINRPVNILVVENGTSGFSSWETALTSRGFNVMRDESITTKAQVDAYSPRPDIVACLKTYWSCSKGSLYWQLYNASYAIFTEGNDNTQSELPAIMSAGVSTCGQSKTTNRTGIYGSLLSDGWATYTDDSEVHYCATTLKNHAHPISTNGTYSGINDIFMHEPGKGYWYHHQPIAVSPDALINNSINALVNFWRTVNYTDTAAADAADPNTPAAPTLSLTSSTSLSVNWTNVEDTGTTNYYYTTAFDAEGNRNNLLLQNPTFESGVTTGWGFWSSVPTGSSMAIDSSTAAQGAYSVKFVLNNSETNPNPQFYHAGYTLWGGETYVLKFYAKADIANQGIQITFLKAVSPYTQYASTGSIPLTTTWAEYQGILSLSTNVNDTNGRIDFYVNGSGPADTVWLDNIRLYRAKPVTLTTGIKNYTLYRQSSRINDFAYGTLGYSDSSLNCFTNYCYNLSAWDNANNIGATGASTCNYTINYVSGCYGTGPSGSCAVGTSCYYTGSGCPTDTNCPIATSSCTYGGCDSTYCLDDAANNCYYGTATCGVSGWADKTSASCLDPGTVSASACYYDNGGSVSRSNDCTATGCTGISSQAAPSSCTSGSWANGAMACWTGTTCYYASSDGCAADTNGWDYSTGTTNCTAASTSCCSGTYRYEGQGCTSTGVTGVAYDRDLNSGNCTTTTGSCTAYTWDANLVGKECCGDDGGATDTTFAIVTSSSPDSCRRCNAGAYGSTSCYQNQACAVSGKLLTQNTDTACTSGTTCYCYRGESCAASGYTAPSSTSIAACDFGSFNADSNANCYNDAADACYYSATDPCTGSGLVNSTATCYDPGYNASSTCYYDTDSGSTVDESNSCSTTGCTGITSCALGTGSTCDPAYGCQAAPALSVTIDANKPLNSQSAMLNLSWTFGGTATNYTIDRSADNGTTWSNGIASPTSTSYSDDNLNDNVYYCYRARANRGGYYSAYSSVVCNTTLDRTGPLSPNLVPGKRGLVGYWKLDEASGNVTDDSAYNSSGFIYNGTTVCVGSTCPTWTNPAKVGAGLTFDATYDHVKITSPTSGSLNPADQIAVSAWVKWSGSTQAGYIVSKGWSDVYDLQITSANVPTFTLVNTTPTAKAVSATSAISKNVWYHLVGTYDGATAKLYINGVLNNSATTTGDIRQASYAVKIGANYQGGEDANPANWRMFNGTIDEVKIFNRAITATEIAEEYNNSKSYLSWTESDSGLLIYLPLEDGSGTTTQDWSPAVKDSTISGTTTWITGKFGNGLNCSASNSLVTIPNGVAIGATWTAEIWSYFPLLNSGTYRTLFRSATADHHVIVSSAGEIGMYNNSGSGFKGSGYNVNSLSGWHHLAAVGSGTTTTFYIDGVNISQSPDKSSNTIDYFCNYQGLGQAWGAVDELRIYNRALTQAEIISDMQSGLINKELSTSTTLSGNYTPVNGTYQDFTAANGDITTLSGWTKYIPAGNTSTYTIESNSLKLFLAGSDATGSQSYAQYSFSAADKLYGTVKVEYDIVWNTTNNWGLFQRVYDSSSAYAIWSGSNGASNWNIYHDGAWDYGTPQPALTAGTTYHMTQIIDYATKKVKYYVNDIFFKETSFYSTSSANLQYIRFGNYGYATADAIYYIDNLKITQLFNTANYTDPTAADAAAPNTPTGLAVTTSGTECSGASSCSFSTSWNNIEDTGTTYYYYLSAIDAEGNENNLVPDWKNYVSDWTTNYYSQFVTSQDMSYGVIHRVINDTGTGDPRLIVNSVITFDNTSSYILMFDMKRASGTEPTRIFLRGSIVDDTANDERTISTFENENKLDLGDGYYRYFVPIYPSDFTGSSNVGGFGWYGDWSGSWTAEYYVKNVKLYKVKSVTLATGIKDYYVAGSGTGGNSWYNYPTTSAAVSALNCNTSYSYNVKARDNALNEGSQSSSVSNYTLSTIPSISSVSCDTGTCTVTFSGCGATGTQFWADEISGNPGGSDSNWQTSTSYADSGLSSCTVYNYTVKSRNGNLINTSASSQSSNKTNCLPSAGAVTYDVGGSSQTSILPSDIVILNATCSDTDSYSDRDLTSCSFNGTQNGVVVNSTVQSISGTSALCSRTITNTNPGVWSYRLCCHDSMGQEICGSYATARMVNPTPGTETQFNYTNQSSQINITYQRPITYNNLDSTQWTRTYGSSPAGRVNNYVTYEGLNCTGAIITAGAFSYTRYDTFDTSTNSWLNRDGQWTVTATGGYLDINVGNSAAAGSVNATTSNYNPQSKIFSFDYKCDSGLKAGMMLNRQSGGWSCIQGSGNSTCGGSYTAIGKFPGFVCNGNWNHTDFVYPLGSNTVTGTIFGDWSSSQTPNAHLYLDNFAIHSATWSATAPAGSSTETICSYWNYPITVYSPVCSQNIDETSIAATAAYLQYDVNITNTAERPGNVLLADQCPTNDATWTNRTCGQRNITLLANDFRRNGLVGYWKFDEGSGSTTADSAGINNGLITSASWTTGRIESALQFSGAGYVNVSNDTSIRVGTLDLTLSAWFKTSSANGQIFDNYGTTPLLRLGVSSSAGYFTLRGTDGVYHTLTTPETVTDNNWHMLAGVRSGDNQLLYLDGVLVDSTTGVSGVNVNTSCPVVIGAANGYPCVVGSTNRFTGVIDDVRLYSRALTQDEIYGDMMIENYKYRTTGDLPKSEGAESVVNYCPTPGSSEETVNKTTNVTNNACASMTDVQYSTAISGSGLADQIISSGCSITTFGSTYTATITDTIPSSSLDSCTISYNRTSATDSECSWQQSGCSCSATCADSDTAYSGSAYGVCSDKYCNSAGSCASDTSRTDSCPAIRSGGSFTSYTLGSCSGIGGQKCNSNSINLDTDSTACTLCGSSVAWNVGTTWAIGGEIDAAACCGNDASEYTEDCARAASEPGVDVCVNSTDDRACCNAASDCVYNNACYATGYQSDVDGDGSLEYCNSGTWDAAPSGTACTLGTECTSDLCIEGTCRASCTGYDFKPCSNDGTNYATGCSSGICRLCWNASAATSSCNPAIATYGPGANFYLVDSGTSVTTNNSWADYSDSITVHQLRYTKVGSVTATGSTFACRNSTGGINDISTNNPAYTTTPADYYGSRTFSAGIDKYNCWGYVTQPGWYDLATAGNDTQDPAVRLYFNLDDITSSCSVGCSSNQLSVSFTSSHQNSGNTNTINDKGCYSTSDCKNAASNYCTTTGSGTCSVSTAVVQGTTVYGYASDATYSYIDTDSSATCGTIPDLDTSSCWCTAGAKDYIAGTVNACCGDDGTSDNFHYSASGDTAPGSTCQSCNAGTYGSCTLLAGQRCVNTGCVTDTTSCGSSCLSSGYAYGYLNSSGGCTCVAATAAFLSGAQASASATVQNADFELYQSSGVATGWVISTAGGVVYTASSDTGTAGAKSQKINITTQASWGLYFATTPSFVLNKTYTWSFRYKTSGTSGFTAQIIDPPATVTVFSKAYSGTSGSWAYDSVNFTYTNSSATQLRFQATSTGTLWFDDVKLSEFGNSTSTYYYNATVDSSDTASVNATLYTDHGYIYSGTVADGSTASTSTSGFACSHNHDFYWVGYPTNSSVKYANTWWPSTAYLNNFDNVGDWTTRVVSGWGSGTSRSATSSGGIGYLNLGFDSSNEYVRYETNITSVAVNDHPLFTIKWRTTAPSDAIHIRIDLRDTANTWHNIYGGSCNVYTEPYTSWPGNATCPYSGPPTSWTETTINLTDSARNMGGLSINAISIAMSDNSNSYSGIYSTEMDWIELRPSWNLRIPVNVSTSTAVTGPVIEVPIEVGQFLGRPGFEANVTDWASFRVVDPATNTEVTSATSHNTSYTGLRILALGDRYSACINNYGTVTQQNLPPLPTDFMNYDIIVLRGNQSAGVLSATDRQNLKDFLASGKGILVVSAACHPTFFNCNDEEWMPVTGYVNSGDIQNRTTAHFLTQDYSTGATYNASSCGSSQAAFTSTKPNAVTLWTFGGCAGNNKISEAAWSWNGGKVIWDSDNMCGNTNVTSRIAQWLTPTNRIRWTWSGSQSAGASKVFNIYFDTTASPKTAPSSSAIWAVEYEGDVLPNATSWTLNENWVGNAVNEVGNGFFHLNTSAANGYWDYSRNWGVTRATGATLEARLRAVSGTTWGNMILVADGSYEEALQIEPTKIKLNYANQAYYMNTTDTFHTYRITIKNADIKVYVDDALAIDGTGNFDIQAASGGRNTTIFGDGSSAAGESGEAYWDYVRYSTAGAHPPLTEVPGSLQNRGYATGPDMDCVAPTSSFTSPNNTQNDYCIKGTSINVQGLASDDYIGVRATEFNATLVGVSAGAWVPTTGTTTWTYSWSPADGNYSIRSRATDKVFNVQTPTQINGVCIDNTNPGQPAAIAPASAALCSSTSQVFNWTVPSDPGSCCLNNNLNYTLYLDTTTTFSSGNLKTIGASSNSTTVAFAGGDYDQIWYWRVNATDRAGNTGLGSTYRQLNLTCVYNNACYGLGSRAYTNYYCDNLAWQPQKADSTRGAETSCTNNYECVSNNCVADADTSGNYCCSNGCVWNNACYTKGFRARPGYYCDGSNWVALKADNTTCSGSYECSSAGCFANAGGSGNYCCSINCVTGGTCRTGGDRGYSSYYCDPEFEMSNVTDFSTAVTSTLSGYSAAKLFDSTATCASSWVTASGAGTPSKCLNENVTLTLTVPRHLSRLRLVNRWCGADTNESTLKTATMIYSDASSTTINATPSNSTNFYETFGLGKSSTSLKLVYASIYNLATNYCGLEELELYGGGNWTSQKANGTSCSNSYECVVNSCGVGYCCASNSQDGGKCCPTPGPQGVCSAGYNCTSLNQCRDTTVPSTTIGFSGGYSNNTWSNSTSVTVTLTQVGCSDGMPCTTYYCQTSSCTPSTTYSSPVAISTEGTNYFRYLTNDTGGNAETVKVALIKLDITAPASTDNHPSDDAWSNGTFSVVLTPTDSISGIATTTYCQTKDCNPCSGTTYGGAVVIATAGLNNFNWCVKDNAGNYWSQADLVKIEGGTPSSSIRQPPNNTYISSTTYVFQTSAADDWPGSDIKNVWFKLDTGAWTKGTGVKDLTGYWKFDEGAGTTGNDTSGNQRTATLLNGPSWTTGQIGNALNFDGNDDVVNVSLSAMDGLTDFTVTYWMNTSDTVNTGSSIMATNKSGSNNEFLLYDYESLQVFIKDSSWNSAVNLSDNSWHHVAVSRSSATGQVVLYVDGVLRGSAILATGALNVGCLMLGQDQDSLCGGFQTSQAFKGKLDEVKIYNRVLSSNEIKDDYNQPSLVGYWKLDEGTGTVAKDYSLSAKDGALTGDASWTNQGESGNAIRVNGATGYVNIPSVNPTTAISVSAWVKSNSSLYYGAWQVVSKYNAYILGGSSTNGNTMCFIISNGTWNYGSCYAVPDPQNWHHFVGTYDSTTGNKYLYVDGILRGSGTGVGTIASDTGPIHLGHQEGGTLTYFNGTIDEVKIFNRALTASEVLDEFNGGLVGYWKFDEGSGAVAADSAGTKNGTISGVTWTTGKIGGALSFDGSEDFVNVTGFTIGNTITLSAWLKSSSYGNKIPLSLNGDTYSSGPSLFFVSNVIAWNTGDGAANSFTNSSYPDSNWHHFAVIADQAGNFAKLYIDGQYIGNASYKNPTVTNNAFTVGMWHDNGAYDFNGQIDDVRIYNRTLTASEIRDEYLKGKDGLAGYWKFDEGTGSNARDSSGNDNTGSLVSSPTWTTGKFGYGLGFDGTTKSVDIPFFLDPASTDFTAELWFEVNNFTGSPVFLSQQDGSGTGRNWLAAASSTKLTTVLGGTTLNANTTLNQNTWYHGAITKAGTTVKIYLNGVLDGQFTATVETATGMHRIGRHKTGTTTNMDGTIDEVAIYSRAKSAEEILTDYLTGRYGPPANWTYLATGISEGTHTLYTLAEDTSGNNQTTSSQITFYRNIGPSVSSITVNGGSAITPTTAFSVNASVTDNDGGTDIVCTAGACPVKCWGPGTSSSCTLATAPWNCTVGNATVVSTAGTTANLGVTFTPDHHMVSGTWTCNVTATDSVSHVASSTNTQTVNTFKNLLVPGSASCAFTATPGGSAVAANCNSAAYLNVTHDGNVNENFVISGSTNFIGTTKNFTIGNLTFGQTSACGTSVTASSQTVYSNVIPGNTATGIATTNPIYLCLTVPLGMPPGSYSANFTIEST